MSKIIPFILGILCVLSLAQQKAQATVLTPLQQHIREEGLSFSKEGGNWELVCDNTLTCRTVGYSSPNKDGEADAALLIERPAGADAKLALQALVLGNNADDQQPTQDFQLLIDHQALPLRFHQPVTVEALRPLCAAFRHDRLVQIRTAKGDLGTLSDRGAMAVFLKMDDVQGRVDTSSALAKTGNRPRSDVTLPLPKPIIQAEALAPTTEHDRQLASSPALLAALEPSYVKSCDGSLQKSFDDNPFDGLRLARLSQNRLLVQARCWQGAYQAGYATWIVDDRSPYVATLLFKDADEIETNGPDRFTGTLSLSSRYPAIGYTWHNQEYVWTKAGFQKSLSTGSNSIVIPVSGGAFELPEYVARVAKLEKIYGGMDVSQSHGHE